ncbi:MAG TPA: hypothetical protein VLL97_15260 [Acidobacteriota bacterium]|nr:hypothetical protein [Acidobacteriota bacterium]
MAAAFSTAVMPSGKDGAAQKAITPVSKIEDGKSGEKEESLLELVHRITGATISDSVLPNVFISEIMGLLSHIKFPEEIGWKLAAINTLEEMRPRNITECMLAVQMIGVHHSAVCLLKNAHNCHSIESIESFARLSIHLMRLFNDQLEAMAKLKGTIGQQKVTVEHVHVNAGGQAIVGAVSSCKDNQGKGGEVGGNDEKRSITP